jgi:hypothetical protein
MARSNNTQAVQCPAVQKTTIPVWHKTDIAVAAPRKLNIHPKDFSANRRTGAFQAPGPDGYNAGLRYLAR